MLLTTGASASDGVKRRGYAPTHQAYVEATSIVNSQRKAAGISQELTPAEVQAIVRLTTLD